MKKRLYSIFALLFTALCLVAQNSMHVGSYNIRYANKGDRNRGNGWESRCPRLVNLINYEQWDIFGAQEVLHSQLQDLKAGLKDYAYIGTGRADGKTKGEYAPIFYRKNRVQCLKNGQFWLSETPDSVASVGWDASMERICTWGYFQDKATKWRFWFFNLHMDHRGTIARAESSKLILAKIDEMCGNEPYILTGDFNANQNEEPYALLTSSGKLKDTYTEARVRMAENGTFNGFSTDRFSTSRIDHIFVSPRFMVHKHGVLTYNYWQTSDMESGKQDKAHVISDHYPIAATIELPRLRAPQDRPQQFHTYKEAKDPVPMSERSIEAWKTVGKLQAQWVSADSLYSRSEVPQRSAVTTCRLEGWRGERVSAQLLLWTGKGADGVKTRLKDFSADNAQLSADIASTGFVRYTLADKGGYDCRCERGPKHDVILVPDMIDSLKVFNMDAQTVRPVCVSINIPQYAKAGVYRSEVVITAKGAKMTLPIELEVIDQLLPTYDQWTYHLDLWQHPSAVARMQNLEMWSDEHFDALRAQMLPLARAGQKVITTTLNRDPWGSQTFDDYEDMIIWTHRKDGTWSFDYTVFDRYVELMMSLGVKKQINCYSMLPWNNRLNWYEEKDNAFKVSSISPKSKKYEEMWSAFLKDFVIHLKEKGWLHITCIATDERSAEEMEIVVRLINTYAPELGFAMADNHASYRRIPNVRDCCVAQRQLYLTKEEIAERRAKGYTTTFYVCCSTYFPNSFTYSQPWESELLSWHAISKDYDGQLRWAYNSWPHRPEYDSRFRTMASGDTYQIASYGRSTLRFERMIDGIEAYEKVRILRQKFAHRPEVLKPLEDKLAEIASLKLTDTTLPWHTLMTELVAELNRVSKER